LKKHWAKLGNCGLVLLPASLFLLSCVYSHSDQTNFWMLEGLNWMVKIAVGLLLFFVANPQEMCARLLCMPWLRWFGIISYEWYLFHQPIVIWTREILGKAQGSVLKYMLIVGGPLLASLIFSALVYRCFSLPLLKYGRSKTGKSH